MPIYQPPGSRMEARHGEGAGATARRGQGAIHPGARLVAHHLDHRQGQAPGPAGGQHRGGLHVADPGAPSSQRSAGRGVPDATPHRHQRARRPPQGRERADRALLVQQPIDVDHVADPQRIVQGATGPEVHHPPRGPAAQRPHRALEGAAWAHAGREHRHRLARQATLHQPAPEGAGALQGPHQRQGLGRQRPDQQDPVGHGAYSSPTTTVSSAHSAPVCTRMIPLPSRTQVTTLSCTVAKSSGSKRITVGPVSSASSQ